MKILAMTSESFPVVDYNLKETEMVFKSETKTKRPRAYFAAASKRARRRRKGEADFLMSRNALLKNDNEVLRFQIQNLNKEIDALNRVELARSSYFRNESLNHGLKRQLTEYRFLTRKVKNFYSSIEKSQKHSDLLFQCQSNVSFLLDKFENLLNWTSLFQPIKPERRENNDDVLDLWLKSQEEEEFGYSDLRTELRICDNGGNERWIRIDGYDLPFSRTKYLEVSKDVEQHSQLMNYGKEKPCGSMDVKPIDVFVPNTDDEFMQNHRVRFAKSKGPEMDAYFISAVNGSNSEKKDSSMVQCVMPEVTSDLELTANTQSFCMRGISVSEGKVPGTTNMTILFGMRMSEICLPEDDLDDPRSKRLVDFERSVRRLKGPSFLKEQFTHEFSSTLYKSLAYKVAKISIV